MSQDAINETIDKLATSGVQSHSEGDKQQELMSIDDLIKAEKHVASKPAAKSRWFGVRVTKLIPPGTG